MTILAITVGVVTAGLAWALLCARREVRALKHEALIDRLVQVTRCRRES